MELELKMSNLIDTFIKRAKRRCLIRDYFKISSYIVYRNPRPYNVVKLQEPTGL